MPGTIIFKPIEASLTHNTDLLTKMSPYCDFNVGGNHFQGQTCPKGGKHPRWTDAVTIPINQETTALINLMDQDKITKDDVIGSCAVNLTQIERQGHVARWYPLYHKSKPAGGIFLEAVYQPNGSFLSPVNYNASPVNNSFSNVVYSGSPYNNVSHNNSYQEAQYYSAQPTYSNASHNNSYQEAQYYSAQPVLHQQQQQSPKVFTEQRQVVEPHTFLKEVEVVETMPVLKEVEVMRPVKVLKDVQLTRAVPVKKQFEIVEPQVVLKEIEVIEPQIVTKTIQVVENVPVMRQIEVVELKSHVQEVETLEPRTFHKQVEVTEMVPTKKQVGITQPVMLKKAVEFVEPVITTETITKELRQPVIVDENFTTTVGPASLVGEVTQTASTTERLGDVVIEKERLSAEELQRARLLEQERLTTQGLQQPVIVDENITTTVGPASLVGEVTQTAYPTQRFGDVVIEKERLRNQGLSETGMNEQKVLGSYGLRQGGITSSNAETL